MEAVKPIRDPNGIVNEIQTAGEDPAAGSSPLSNFERQLLLIQQQVDHLQFTAQEKRKPWWRQLPLVLSILSLSISTLFSLYTQIDQSRQREQDAAKQRAASLAATLSDLAAIRMEDTKQMVALATSNVAAYRAWTATATVKRATLIDSAMDEIGKLNGVLSPTAALTMGNELIIDGRYSEAERLLQAGIAAAQRGKTPPAALLSSLAQVYLYPGSPLFDAPRGRALYRRAIESYSSRGDYYILNTKINLILYWAVNEHGFGNGAVSSQLLDEAQEIVRNCDLPEAAKTTLRSSVAGVEAQLKLQGAGPSLLSSRLAGKWRIVEPDSESSDLVLLSGSAPAYTAFTRDRMMGGKLVERISGTATILDQTRMRLDWAAAFDMGVPGLQKTGYSDVWLGSDAALHGTDFGLGLPPRNWTARMVVDNVPKPHSLARGGSR
jgi:hypothetical protein